MFCLHLILSSFYPPRISIILYTRSLPVVVPLIIIWCMCDNFNSKSNEFHQLYMRCELSRCYIFSMSVIMKARAATANPQSLFACISGWYLSYRLLFCLLYRTCFNCKNTAFISSAFAYFRYLQKGNEKRQLHEALLRLPQISYR